MKKVINSIEKCVLLWQEERLGLKELVDLRRCIYEFKQQNDEEFRNLEFANARLSAENSILRKCYDEIKKEGK